MHKPIKLGIWGCEHGIKGHGVVVNRIKGVDLEGLCDRKQETMWEACHQLRTGIFCYTEPEEMLKKIDAVIIATPDEYHIEHARMALNMGLHVLVEKPIIVAKKDIDDFRQLLDIAKEKNLVFTSCHPRRFDPPFIWLKENLKRFVEKFGNIDSFHYDFTYHEPWADWKQLSRSLLLDHHGHEIDLVNFIFGHEDFSEELHDDSADRYLVTGRRDDSIRFSFHGSRRRKDEVYLEWMTVRFETGSITIHANTGEVTIKDHTRMTVELTKCPAMNYEVRSFGVTGNFIGTILGEEENYLSRHELLLNNISGVMLLEKGCFVNAP